MRKAIFSSRLYRPVALRQVDGIPRRLIYRGSREQVVPCVFTANIRGGFMTKADELEVVLQNNYVDIACLTETWLADSVPTEVVNVSGYVIHRNDRKDGRRGGGVAVLVRQNVPCQRLSALETPDIESVWLLYRLSKMTRVL